MIECCLLKENILVSAISGIVPLSESPLFKFPFCVVGARGLQKAMFMRICAYLEGWNVTTENKGTLNSQSHIFPLLKSLSFGGRRV